VGERGAVDNGCVTRRIGSRLFATTRFGQARLGQMSARRDLLRHGGTLVIVGACGQPATRRPDVGVAAASGWVTGARRFLSDASAIPHPERNTGSVAGGD